MIRISREQIEEAFRSMLGVPFKKGGVDRFGLDCTGLLFCVRGEIGLDTEYPDNEERFPNGAKSWVPRPGLLQKYMLANFEFANLEEMSKGDLISFNLTGRTEEHVGVLVEEPKYGNPFVEGFGLLHVTHKTKQVKVEPISKRFWDRRVHAYRFREVID